MPRVPVEKVLTVMLVNCFQDLANWGVPGFAVRSVPFSRHETSYLRLLELRIANAFRVRDPREQDAEVVVKIKDPYHRPSYNVHIPVFSVNEVAVVG
jgi:hypothetical protein